MQKQVDEKKNRKEGKAGIALILKNPLTTLATLTLPLCHFALAFRHSATLILAIMLTPATLVSSPAQAKAEAIKY